MPIDPKKIEEWNERYRFSGPDSRYRNKGTSWFEFGRHPDGRIDISDGERDVFEAVPEAAGKAIVDLHAATVRLLSEREELLLEIERLRGEVVERLASLLR